MDFKEKVRTQISLSFQFLLIFISTLILGTLIYWRSSSFLSRENKPTINPITPQKVQELGGFSHTVTVGLTIEEFISFNMVSNNFTFDGTVWFRFNPGSISLDSLSDFEFVKGTFEKKSEPDIRIIDTQMFVQYTVRVKFSTSLNYEDFPLDNHNVFAILINKSISPSEVIFESSKQELNVIADVGNEGWHVYDTTVRPGYIESTLDPHDSRQNIIYPAVLFEMSYARNSIRYALSILLPLALIFYLLLFTVSLRLLSAIAISSAGITAILAYRFVIENLSPKTGTFMISDYIFFLFLAATICTFLLNVAEMSGYKLSAKAKMSYIAILHALIIFSIIYIIVW